MIHKASFAKPKVPIDISQFFDDKDFLKQPVRFEKMGLLLNNIISQRHPLLSMKDLPSRGQQKSYLALLASDEG